MASARACRRTSWSIQVAAAVTATAVTSTAVAKSHMLNDGRDELATGDCMATWGT